MCILLIAPLGLIAALLGGWTGRAIAKAGHHRGTALMSVAVLPLLFSLEAVMPPAVPVRTAESIDIAALPEAVWRSITSDQPIGSSPGLPGRPIRYAASWSEKASARSGWVTSLQGLRTNG